MILTNFRTYLLTVNGVSSLVATRVFPNVIPQGVTLPAIRLTKVSGMSFHRHGPTQLGKASSVVQVDAYAVDYSSAETLADKIRIACHQYKGTLGTLKAASIFKTDGRSFEDMPEDGSSAVRRVVSQDFRIIHSEATS